MGLRSQWASCTTQGCTKGGHGGQSRTNQPEWPWLRPKRPWSRPEWARSRPEWARSRPEQPWPQPRQLQLWPRIQQRGDQTTREFLGHWLSPDWAVMWHHTENRDQATTTVVGYPVLRSMLLLYWRVAFVLVQHLGVRLPCRSLVGWSHVVRLLANCFADRFPRNLQRLPVGRPTARFLLPSGPACLWLIHRLLRHLASSLPVVLRLLVQSGGVR